MALLRTVDLVLNNARTPGLVLLASLTDLGPASPPQWIEADKFRVRLRFADLPANLNGSATSVALENDNVIVLAGKKVRGTGVVLFAATDFTKVTVGSPVTDVYYQAILTLNTANLAAAFGSETQIEVAVDVQIEAPDVDGGADNDRLTYPFTVIITRQSYAGEPTPAEGDPAYPAAELLTLKAPVNGAYRFVSDGGAGTIFQLKNGTTGLFHTVFVTGASGAEVLTIGPGEA